MDAVDWLKPDKTIGGLNYLHWEIRVNNVAADPMNMAQ